MTTWLIDKSAISRLHLADNAAEWAERIERGLVRISTDVPTVAMIRLIARAVIVTPHAAGRHTQRLAEQLDELRG